MPIYEYYCPDNHTIYQFYAKTLAQGQTVPKCPGNPGFRMERIVSNFAIQSGVKNSEANAPLAAGDADLGSAEDSRIEAAMGEMEKEFSHLDENDPRAMARMMRKMAELTGEKIDGQMEEVVRKLEEGADPDSLEDQLGGPDDTAMDDDGMGGGVGGSAADLEKKEKRHRFRKRTAQPRRDPTLYDY